MCRGAPSAPDASAPDRPDKQVRHGGASRLLDDALGEDEEALSRH